MFYGPPSANEIALNYTMEYSTNSPRLRTSIVAYLLDAKVTPEVLGGMDEFIAAANQIAEFVGEKSEAFFAEVNPLAETSQPDPSEIEIKGPETGTESGYNYL